MLEKLLELLWYVEDFFEDLILLLATPFMYIFTFIQTMWEYRNNPDPEYWERRVEEDQKEIADFYKMSPEDLKVYLSLLSNYRNLCAHEDIVYEHKTQTYINDTYYHYKLNIPKNDLGEYTKGRNDLFALIIILKQVLQVDRFKEFMNEINRCFEIFDLNVNTIDNKKLFDKMGFPENYMDIIDIRGGLDE
jgi:abortive infection bacteriophage resistance protein